MLKRQFTARLNVLNLNHEYRSYENEWASGDFELVSIFKSSSSSSVNHWAGVIPSCADKSRFSNKKPFHLKRSNKPIIYIQKEWEQLHCIQYFTILVSVEFQFSLCVHSVTIVNSHNTYIYTLSIFWHNKMNSQNNSIDPVCTKQKQRTTRKKK